MHIAYIHQYFTTPSGSTGTRSYEFARRWVKAGHRVTVITSVAQLKEELNQAKKIRRGIKQLHIEGIEILALEIPYHQTMGRVRRLWSFLQFLWRASLVVIRLKNIDIVFATSTPLTVAVPALVNRFCRGIPFIFEVRDLQPRGIIAHGIVKNKLIIKALRWFEKLTYFKSAGIVALSIDMKGYIDKVTKDSAKTITVPNCSDNELFKPLKGQERQKTRAQLGGEDKFIIAHAGIMGKVNGLYRVIETASRIQDHREICFVLIGEGKEKPRLEQMVKNLKLNNIKFMEPLPKVELSRVLPAADVGMVSIDRMPHMQFNSANKFFDALACGLPVLLNYGGWQKEVLDKYNAGLGCDILNEDEFSENILTLLKDPNLRQTMGQNARRLAENEFDRDILAQKVLDHISRGLAKSQK
jgi:glycosyltransferase involved in cell wall biosynthesis